MKLNSIIQFAAVLACAGIVHIETANAATEKVIYAFGGGTDDGAYPEAALLDVGGTLYGTTVSGGASGAYGTMFSITLGGTETVLHSFGQTGDGSNPYAALIDVGGTLYGTTESGGTGNNYGTVFSVKPKTGAEAVLYSFQNTASSGEQPFGSLIDVKGKLYGTTLLGGIGRGTAFSINLKTGAEKVLYSFCQQEECADGDQPYDGLIDVSGKFYGTTQAGGATGNGIVFSIGLKGTLKLLHSFGGSSTDGGFPTAGLINVNGTLYGTTEIDGAYGGGIAFSITPRGKETALHFFGQAGDGSEPYAGLIEVGGKLYGTTLNGGGTGCGGSGCGTVFSLNPKTGAEAVLYAFQGGSDGANPYAGLINVKGTLYGTTLGRAGRIRWARCTRSSPSSTRHSGSFIRRCCLSRQTCTH